MKLTIIDHEGASHQVHAETGEILMHVLRDNIDLNVGICGGEISCGTCLVRLAPEWAERIDAAGGDEAEMLEALAAENNDRLGCQIILGESADGMRATLLNEE